MDEYTNKLLLGDHSMLLNDAQRSLVSFEEQFLREKYTAYLQQAKNEADMQYLFESNPALLPGLYDLHNGPVGNVVISKLQLGDEYVTDFSFISSNSAVAQITLIEIESPAAEIFRASDDEFTSAFNRAYQQIRDWELWAEQNSTYLKERFRRIYGRNIFKYQKVMTRRILIAGRRSSICENPRREKRWASVNNNYGTIVMSYDRLADIFHIDARLLQKLVCKPAYGVHSALKGA